MILSHCLSIHLFRRVHRILLRWVKIPPPLIESFKLFKQNKLKQKLLSQLNNETKAQGVWYYPFFPLFTLLHLFSYMKYHPSSLQNLLGLHKLEAGLLDSSAQELDVRRQHQINLRTDQSLFQSIYYIHT